MLRYVIFSHKNNQALAPQAMLKFLPLAPSWPEDAFGFQVDWDSAAGKEFNTALWAGLDS